MPKKRKPSPPRAILTPEERQDIREQVARLRSTGVDVRTDKTGRIYQARRIDAFQHLLERHAITQDGFDAVRKLETLLGVAGGHESAERSGEFVDRSSEGAPGQNVTQAMINASRLVMWTYRLLSRRDKALFDGLRVSTHKDWNAVVKEITGETDCRVQAGAVRHMAENIMDALQRAPALAFPKEEMKKAA